MSSAFFFLQSSAFPQQPPSSPPPPLHFSWSLHESQSPLSFQKSVCFTPSTLTHLSSCQQHGESWRKDCAIFIYRLPYTFNTNSFLRYVGEERETNTHWEFFYVRFCAHKLFYLILIRTPWGRWIHTCFNICLGDTNLPKVQQLLEVKLRFDFLWIQVCLILNLLFFPLLPSSQWTSLWPFR